jgi:hypothetical protein
MSNRSREVVSRSLKDQFHVLSESNSASPGSIAYTGIYVAFFITEYAAVVGSTIPCTLLSVKRKERESDSTLCLIRG